MVRSEEGIDTGPGFRPVPLPEMEWALPGLPQPSLQFREPKNLRLCLLLQPLYRIQPLLISQRSHRVLIPHPDYIIPEWDLDPPLLSIHGLHGLHRLLSGPKHLARGSLRVLGLSLRSIQLLRVLHGHRLSYPLLRGLGIHYFTMTRYPGMWIVVPRTFMESPIMIYQHWQRTHSSEIL